LTFVIDCETGTDLFLTGTRPGVRPS